MTYGASVVYAADVLLALDDRGAGVPLRELALVGLTAAIITYFATGWVRALARRLGAVAIPRDRDVHSEPIPRMGGLAMYIGVVSAVLLASQLPALTRGFVYSTGMPAVVVAGAVVVVVVGQVLGQVAQLRGYRGPAVDEHPHMREPKVLSEPARLGEEQGRREPVCGRGVIGDHPGGQHAAGRDTRPGVDQMVQIVAPPASVDRGRA